MKVLATEFISLIFSAEGRDTDNSAGDCRPSCISIGRVECNYDVLFHARQSMLFGGDSNCFYFFANRSALSDNCENAETVKKLGVNVDRAR